MNLELHATMPFVATVGPVPVPDLPVDPTELPGRPLIIAHGRATAFNSIPDPAGGYFGLNKLDLVLTIDMPFTTRLYNFWDAVSEAKKRAAASGAQPAAYAVLQARNGYYYLAQMRAMPPRNAPFVWLDMPSKVRVDFDMPRVKSLKAIVGSKFMVNFTDNQTPPPALRGIRTLRKRRHKH